MPRPSRKPKKLDFLAQQNKEPTAPVNSTHVHLSHPITNPPLSPNLTPLHDNINFPIYEDQDAPLQDEFGFSQVRGIKKSAISMPVESDSDHDVDDNQPSKEEEDAEDLYGDPEGIEDRQSSPPRPTSPVPKLKKPIRQQTRTSELLHLLPARKKRSPTRHQKKMPAQCTSDDDSEVDRVTKRRGKKRRVVDKENDVPEETSEEESEVVERRKIVKLKFAEIDQWEMAFESVDLSFSSQTS
jgi:hypothetical protein